MQEVSGSIPLGSTTFICTFRYKNQILSTSQTLTATIKLVGYQPIFIMLEDLNGTEQSTAEDDKIIIQRYAKESYLWNHRGQFYIRKTSSIMSGERHLSTLHIAHYGLSQKFEIQNVDQAPMFWQSQLDRDTPPPWIQLTMQPQERWFL